MDITELAFKGDVHRAYTLALVSTLDLLFPEQNILDVVTKIAESIYEKVITSDGLGDTEETPSGTESGSKTPENSDGSSKND